MIGAVAALAVAANRKHKRHNRYQEETATEDATPSEPVAGHEQEQNPEEEEQEEGPNLDDLIRLDDIDVTNSKNNKVKSVLKFRKIPWALWIVGFVVVLMSCFLFYHLAPGNHGAFIPGYREGHWWQYLIAVLILLLGLAFIYAGKVESIVFDKKVMWINGQKKELVKRKTSVICRSTKKKFNLEEITSVQGVKKGHDGINVNTIHYKIEIELKDKPTLKVLESIYREKVRKQVYVINKFLYGQCPAHALAFIDHSTHL